MNGINMAKERIYYVEGAPKIFSIKHRQPENCMQVVFFLWKTENNNMVSARNNGCKG
jgi:uncharacterized protein YeaC (DUF1315 family)